MSEVNNKNIRNLFIQEIITSFGYLAPLSMLAIFLSENKEIHTDKIGFAMFISSITARWGRLLFSPIFDKIKANLLLSLMQITGAIGYYLLSFYQNYSVIILSLILIGLFYGSNSIITRVLTSFSDKNNNNSTKKFSILHIGTNISATIGPIIINLIYIYFNKNFAFLFLGIFLTFSGLFTFFSMKNIEIPVQKNLLKTIFQFLFRKDLWHIYFLILISWFFCAQLYSLAPILLSHILKNNSYIWIISAINGAMVIFISLKINTIMNNYSKNYYFQISISLILAIFGFSSLIIYHSVFNIVLGVLFLTFSEILFIPAFQALLAEYVPEDSRVAIFAIYALFMGIGEGTGYFFGTKSLDFLNTDYSWYNNSLYFLTIFIIIGIIISIRKTSIIKNNEEL